MSNENPIRPLLSNKTYGIVKWMVQTAFPLLGSLYFGLAQTWNLPASEQVVGSLALLATFFGAVLGVSSKRYNAANSNHDGEMVLAEDDDGKMVFSLNLDDDPANLTGKDSISFKVVK